MFNKLRNVFFIFIALAFSWSIHANEIKNKDKIFKFYSQSKNQKLKKRKIFVPKKKKSNTSLRKLIYKPMPCEREIEICAPPIDCDVEFTDIEVASKIIYSDYGSKMMQSVQKILDVLKNMYFDTIEDLDYDSKATFEDFIPFDNINFDKGMNFEDFEKRLFAHNENDLTSDSIISNIKPGFLKNIILEGLFNEYIVRNQILDAEKMYYLRSFDFDDEDDLDDFSDCTNILIIAYMRNNDFEKAKALACTIQDEWYRDDSLRLIVKYYARRGDIENAKKVIEKMCGDYYKTDGELYIVDYFARHKRIEDFQQFVFSKNDEEFIQAANFILNIHQNNFEEAEKSMPDDYESILYNIVEGLVSSNRIEDAEYRLNYFGDEWDREYLNTFLINAYLKNGQIDEAKKIRDEITDPFDKILVSKLIAIYQNG